MKIILVLVFSLVAISANADVKKTTKKVAQKKIARMRAPASSDQSILLKQHPEIKADCAPKAPEVLNLDVRLNPAEHEDLIASCPSNCGMGGCPYSIYAFENGGYRKIAEFFGLFDVLPEESHGFHDISVHGSMGSDVKQDYVLKFDGQKYN